MDLIKETVGETFIHREGVNIHQRRGKQVCRQWQHYTAMDKLAQPAPLAAGAGRLIIMVGGGGCGVIARRGMRMHAMMAFAIAPMRVPVIPGALRVTCRRRRNHPAAIGHGERRNRLQRKPD